VQKFSDGPKEPEYSFEEIVRGSIASKLNVMDFLNPLSQ